MKFLSTYIFTLILVVSCMKIDVSEATKHPPDKVRKLPAFSFYTLDSKMFSNKDLNKDQRLMIVYFNPRCEVCIKETKEILENINFFNDIQLVMVSPNDLEYVKEFAVENNIKDYNQVTILHDKND